jgi:hypothetical protein
MVTMRFRVCVFDGELPSTPQSKSLTHTESPVDIADLDLLDDETRHACCIVCYPVYEPGRPFVGLCGRKAVSFGGESGEPPPNACPDCLELYDKPCRRCGT